MSKKEARDPYATVCLSRLTRVLDMDVLEPFQSLEHSFFVMNNLAGEEKQRPHRSFIEKSSDKLNKLMSKKGHRIFGHPLTVEGVQRIYPLMEYLKLHLEKEGLFRISGSKKRQEDLKELVDKAMFVDLNASKFTPHDVATILKQFLAELPEPLLTQELYNAFLQIAERGNDRSKNIEALQLLFLFLPPTNRQLLQHLLMLLNAVAQNPKNKMTAHNLALLFSPSIMYIRKQRVTCISQLPEDMSSMNCAIACMILNASELFKIADDLKAELEFTSLMVRQRAADGELPMHRTFCKQINNRSHRASVQKSTTDALLQLYSDVMDMPDGPIKRNFLDKFNRCYPGTPPFIPSRKKGKIEVPSSTPLHSHPPSAFLARNPLSPVNRSSPLRTVQNPMKASHKRSKSQFPRGRLAAWPSAEPMKKCFDSKDVFKTPSGSLYKHKRTPTSYETSAVLSKRQKQLVMQTPSGCLETWGLGETPMSPSDSIKEIMSSTPIDQYACRGLVGSPGVTAMDLSLEVYSV